MYVLLPGDGVSGTRLVPSQDDGAVALWGLTTEGEAQVSVPALWPVAPQAPRPGPGLHQAAPPDGREAAWGGGGGAGR